jgi:hypothetical protein
MDWGYSKKGTEKNIWANREKWHEAEELHDAGLSNSYLLPNIIRAIKYRGVRWADM